MKLKKYFGLISCLAALISCSELEGNFESKKEKQSEVVRAALNQGKSTESVFPTMNMEVCFVLDTTGSMGGLIDGAKRKIWSIANEMAQRENVGNIQFSLVGYRDRGDDYITQVHSLTEDLDLLYGELMKFSANGGGDGPESVNQALNEAVNEIKWTESDDVYKVIFLVGDAPPHMDYQDDVPYTRSGKQAEEKGIVINTLQCGSDDECKNFWTQIAVLGNGEYVDIPQDGGTVQVTAPQDQKIAELSVQIYNDVVCYGDEDQRLEVWKKQSQSLDLAFKDVEGNASRNAYYNVHRSNGAARAISGKGDLVNDWAVGNVTLETLDPDELPEEFKGLNKESIKKELKKRVENREKIQETINELQVQRAKYLDEYHKKNADVGKDSFDQKIKEILNEQLKVKGGTNK